MELPALAESDAGVLWGLKVFSNTAVGPQESKKRAFSIGLPQSTRMFRSAAFGGQPQFLQWVSSLRRKTICAAAAQKGSLGLLQWARGQGCPWDADVCVEAAKKGHLAILQWARSKGCPWNAEVCSAAFWKRHFNVLQWALAHKCPFDDTLLDHAAISGQLAVLQWAHTAGARQREFLCEMAAAGGDLIMLKWARSVGYSWDADLMCWNAVRSGKLEVLQWVHLQGCPLTRRAYSHAAEEGALDMIRYMRSQGCSWDGDVMRHAAEGGRLAMVLWLCEESEPCPFPNSVAWVRKRVRDRTEISAACARVVSVKGGCRLTEAEMGAARMLVKSQITLVLCLREVGLGPELAAVIGKLAYMPWL